MFLVQGSCENKVRGNVRLLEIQNLSSGVKKSYLDFLSRAES